MKTNAYIWLVMNVLAVLVAAVILIAPIEPAMRILWVGLLIINSAALPGRITNVKRPNDQVER